jgi:hypothetical protein
MFLSVLNAHFLLSKNHPLYQNRCTSLQVVYAKLQTLLLYIGRPPHPIFNSEYPVVLNTMYLYSLYSSNNVLDSSHTEILTLYLLV